MMYQARVTAYDCLDEVYVTAQVWEVDSQQEPNRLVYQRSTSFPGTGEADSREWLRDALVGMIEAY